MYTFELSNPSSVFPSPSGGSNHHPLGADPLGSPQEGWEEDPRQLRPDDGHGEGQGLGGGHHQVG